MNAEMEKKEIFRSQSFNDKTKWAYPLKAVELITDGETFQFLVYDVGSEPPFYDVNSLPNVLFAGLIENIQRPYTVEKLNQLLESRGIYVDKWTKVSHLLLHESNAIIRPEIRVEIRSVFGYTDNLPDAIPANVGVDAIKRLAEFDGQSAHLKIKFLEKTELSSFSGFFYLRFRNPEKYSHWGFVGKGSPDNVSILIASEKDFYCQIYDQVNQCDLASGRVTELTLEFISLGKIVKFTKDGFSQLDLEKVTEPMKTKNSYETFSPSQTNLARNGLKLYQVGKAFNISHVTLIEYLEKLGYSVDGLHSVVDDEMMRHISSHFKKDIELVEKYQRKIQDLKEMKNTEINEQRNDIKEGNEEIVHEKALEIQLKSPETILEAIGNGSYKGRKLGEGDVTEICDYFIPLIYGKLLGNDEVVHQWKQTEKSLARDALADYLTMVYVCVAGIQDNIDNSKDDSELFKSSVLVSIDLLDFIETYQSSLQPLEQIPIWWRKGKAYRLLRQYEKAIEIYDDGINYLIHRTSKNRDLELLFSKYTYLEILYASKGLLCERIGNFSEANHCFETVLSLIAKRGLDDFVNDDFPNGLKNRKKI